MPRIQVILNPVLSAFGAGTQQRVVGLTVDMNYMGAGATLATASPQPAELNFFEATGPSDTQGSQSMFATLNGRISLNGQAPLFDAAGEFIRYRRPGVRTEPYKSGPAWFPPVQSTDWFLSLTFDQRRFVNVDHISKENERLFLPWFPEEGEGGTMEVGAELRIGSAQEFFFLTQNVVSVACTHGAVHLDGNNAEPRAAFYGCGMVHPRDNSVFRDFPAARGRITCPAVGGVHTIEVNFHESVDVLVTSWQRIIGVMVAQFQELGLIIADRHGLTDTQARTAGFEYRGDAMRGNEKTWMASASARARLPFFTFWVFYSHEVVSAGVAVGVSEGKRAVQANGATSTKDVIYPVRLLGPLRGELSNLGTPEQSDLHVANIISHEIGHSLGFDHVLEARHGHGYSLPPSEPDVARALMSWENLGAFRFTRQRRFGPVHAAMIARDYL